LPGVVGERDGSPQGDGEDGEGTCAQGVQEVKQKEDVYKDVEEGCQEREEGEETQACPQSLHQLQQLFVLHK